MHYVPVLAWAQATYRAGVSTLPLAAVGCTRREASIALAANLDNKAAGHVALPLV